MTPDVTYETIGKYIVLCTGLLIAILLVQIVQTTLFVCKWWFSNK